MWGGASSASERRAAQEALGGGGGGGGVGTAWGTVTGDEGAGMDPGCAEGGPTAGSGAAAV
jgi:hypothetical protein